MSLIDFLPRGLESGVPDGKLLFTLTPWRGKYGTHTPIEVYKTFDEGFPYPSNLVRHAAMMNSTNGLAAMSLANFVKQASHRSLGISIFTQKLPYSDTEYKKALAILEKIPLAPEAFNEMAAVARDIARIPKSHLVDEWPDAYKEVFYALESMASYLGGDHHDIVQKIDRDYCTNNRPFMEEYARSLVHQIDIEARQRTGPTNDELNKIYKNVLAAT